MTRDGLAALRALALIVVAAGAMGSLGLMFLAGSRQRSMVLAGLFTAWVLLPFAALFRAGMVSNHWPRSRRGMLYVLMLILTAVSLAMYDGLVPMPAGSRPAAVFLMVPAGSWVLMALAAFAGRRGWMRRA